MGIAKTRTHGTDMVINRQRLKALLDQHGMEYMDLYHAIVDRYKLDLSYKGFMSIIAGKATWKLLYAYAIIDVLNVRIMDIFDVIEISHDKNDAAG